MSWAYTGITQRRALEVCRPNERRGVLHLAENRQEIDKSAACPIRYAVKLLLELVELTGVEPVTW